MARPVIVFYTKFTSDFGFSARVNKMAKLWQIFLWTHMFLTAGTSTSRSILAKPISSPPMITESLFGDRIPLTAIATGESASSDPDARYVNFWTRITRKAMIGMFALIGSSVISRSFLASDRWLSPEGISIGFGLFAFTIIMAFCHRVAQTEDLVWIGAPGAVQKLLVLVWRLENAMFLMMAAVEPELILRRPSDLINVILFWTYFWQRYERVFREYEYHGYNRDL